MHSIEILIFDGFDELDVVAPFEILASAGFHVDLVTFEQRSNVHGSHGLSVCPHRVLGAAPDLLVVPGGGWATRAPAGAWAEVRRGGLPAAIAERHSAGSQVAGVCSGVMLLAASGMLRGRPAVTHRCALDDLRQAGADVHPEARVVDDGDVLTAGGVTSAIDLALHIVTRERGYDAAFREAQRLEHDFRGPVLNTAPDVTAR
jgi:transcriptional regulator GlxA family with amidase domain